MPFEGVGCFIWRLWGGQRGEQMLPRHWCLQAVPEMTELLKKK